MASSGINFENLTPPNRAVESVREILFKEILSPEAIGRFTTVMRQQYNGQKLAIVGEFGPMGKKATGCDPVYGNDLASTEEKVWDIAHYEVAQSLCYSDLLGTLVQEALRMNTDIGNLTGTEYMTRVVLPLLRTAIEKAVFRISWFGDKTAKAATSGGVLRTGVDADLFTLTDGLWKRLYAAVTEDSNRRVTISANAADTYSEQESGIAGSGVATGIMNSLIEKAPVRLRQASGQQILITVKLQDALNADIRNNNKGSELQWQSIFGGIRQTSYNGIDLFAIPLWDEMIQSFEGKYSTGDNPQMVAWNQPFRAVYTTKANLLVGTESDSEIANLDVFFERKSRKNHIYANDSVGTLIKDSGLFQVAY